MSTVIKYFFRVGLRNKNSMNLFGTVLLNKNRFDLEMCFLNVPIFEHL